MSPEDAARELERLVKVSREKMVAVKAQAKERRKDLLDTVRLHHGKEAALAVETLALGQMTLAEAGMILAALPAIISDSMLRDLASMHQTNCIVVLSLLKGSPLTKGNFADLSNIAASVLNTEMKGTKEANAVTQEAADAILAVLKHATRGKE